MKKILSIIMAAILCLSFAACSSAPNSSAVTESSQTPASSENSVSEESNAPVLSGKVTVYMPSPAGLADKIAAGFKEKTGVEVEVFQGTTGEILARLEAESANPIADVVILASWSDGLSMKNDGKLMEYKPENADKISEGFIDSDNTLFGYSASAVGVIYNTTLIPTLSANWSELANPEYKDMISIPDPEKSGACKDFVAGFANKYGMDTFEALAENGMVNGGANKAALEAVTTGETGILIAGVDYNAYSSIDKGEPLAIYYPEDGTVVNPRPAMIMKTAPNIDNAKAFVDYLFSDEAQTLVADAYLLPGRSDIKCDKRTNLSDIPQIECDWNKMMEIASDTAAQVNELCAG